MSSAGPALALARALHGGIGGLRRDVDALAGLDSSAAQLRVRRLERRMAVTYMAALLAEQAQRHFEETGSGRLAYLAARFATRLGGPAADAAAGDDNASLAHFQGIPHGRA